MRFAVYPSDWAAQTSILMQIGEVIEEGGNDT